MVVTRGLTVRRGESLVEPVLLGELKSFLQIDFDDHNTLLNTLLVSARESVEKFTGTTLCNNVDMVARFEECSTEEIPYGPVKSITSVLDKNDGEVSHEIEGLLPGHVKIALNRESPTIIRYIAGSETIPYPLKVAIMKLATDNFEQRTGFDLSGRMSMTEFPNNWKVTATPYRRITWLA